MTGRVLVVEDDEAIAVGIVDRLRAEGYDAASETNGTTALARAREEHWNLLILDLMLPGLDGISVCRELRSSGSDVPILMLTARSELDERVRGLRTGADDYLTKPFEVEELLARVEAVLRRVGSGATTHPSYRIGLHALDLKRRELVGPNGRTQLAKYEYRLLKYLCEHRGETVDRETLLVSVWGYGSALETRTVDQHVVYLRKKLGDSEHQLIIRTIRGHGYRLEG